MSDFKIGDKVYYFFHNNDCSLIWSLDDLRLDENAVTSISQSGNPAFDAGYPFLPEDAIFKSKHEAIDAMIKRLEEMREE